VTGAAGTIGSNCPADLEYNRSGCFVWIKVRPVFSISNSSFRTQQQGDSLGLPRLDVGDCKRMQSLVAEHGPEVVFHAAAYKHVPVMEGNAHEAVKNNIFALLTLLDVVEEGGCQSFVLISSDKAVIHKHHGRDQSIGELIVGAGRPVQCGAFVRFGNVLARTGVWSPSPKATSK